MITYSSCWKLIKTLYTCPSGNVRVWFCGRLFDPTEFYLYIGYRYSFYLESKISEDSSNSWRIFSQLHVTKYVKNNRNKFPHVYFPTIVSWIYLKLAKDVWFFRSRMGEGNTSISLITLKNEYRVLKEKRIFIIEEVLVALSTLYNYTCFL